MNKLGRNTLALGVSTLLITSAVSFSANAATEYETHAEARFLGGTNGLGLVADQVSRAIEGQEADCSAEDLEANDCPVIAEQSDIQIPIGDLAGLTLGAVDNYAEAGEDGTSLASSGVVGDDGFIDTDYEGPEGSVTLELNEGQLTGPVADALADLQISLGAVSAQASYDAVTDTVERDYNIASATVQAELPVLDTINDALSGALEDFDLLGEIGNTNSISLSTLGDLFPTELGPILDLVELVGENAVDVEVNFPSVNSLTASLSDFTGGGVTIDIEEGTVTVDLEAVLNNLDPALDINDLPANTDLLQFLLPAISQALDTVVSDALDTIVAQIVDNSSVTVTLLPSVELPTLPIPGLPELGQSITLDGNALDPLIQPLADNVVPALEQLGDDVLTPLFNTVLADDALGQVAKVTVNNHDPDLYGEELVEDQSGDVGTTALGDVYSQTAVRIQLLGGQAADLRLANVVVGPSAEVDIADDVDGTDTDIDVDGTDNDAQADADAVADADSDAQADAAADADAQADADVTTTLPATGAPNLLPFWLLGLGLVLFGAAVLINERRRLKI